MKITISHFLDYKSQAIQSKKNSINGIETSRDGNKSINNTPTQTEPGRLPGRKKDIMDKKLQQQYQAYLRSEKYDIYDAYATPSKAKIEAWRECVDRCTRDGGYGIRIISKNTFSFSVGYLSRVYGGDFNDIRAYTTFTYITKNNIRTATV